jgi:CheY-like chemotaxis protein
MSTSTSVDVLLIDDRMIDADMTLLALQRVTPHLKVLTLKSGNEALEYLFAVGDFAGCPQGKPRLALLDAEMPIMSGLSLLDLMRAHPTTRNIPVVVLSSRPLPSMLKRNDRFAADAYIARPLDLAQYSALLDPLLRRWIPWSRRNKSVDRRRGCLPTTISGMA